MTRHRDNEMYKNLMKEYIREETALKRHKFYLTIGWGLLIAIIVGILIAFCI